MDVFGEVDLGAKNAEQECEGYVRSDDQLGRSARLEDALPQCDEKAGHWVVLGHTLVHLSN